MGDAIAAQVATVAVGLGDKHALDAGEVGTPWLVAAGVAVFAAVAPARLKLMTTLTAVSEAEFATVRDALDVSDSVLSKHLGALEEVGYVRRHKSIHPGRRTTWISLTPGGRKALSAHVTALRALIDGID